jgi:hypothetical protein
MESAPWGEASETGAKRTPRQAPEHGGGESGHERPVEAHGRVYVPSFQVLRYRSCSGVSVSMPTPMLLSLRRATSLSMAGGTM